LGRERGTFKLTEKKNPQESIVIGVVCSDKREGKGRTVEKKIFHPGGGGAVGLAKGLRKRRKFHVPGPDYRRRQPKGKRRKKERLGVSVKKKKGPFVGGATAIVILAQTSRGNRGKPATGKN